MGANEPGSDDDPDGRSLEEASQSEVDEAIEEAEADDEILVGS